MVSGASSGMCELTNERRLGIWEGEGLKETGAYERTDVICGIKTFVFTSVVIAS